MFVNSKKKHWHISLNFILSMLLISSLSFLSAPAIQAEEIMAISPIINEHEGRLDAVHQKADILRQKARALKQQYEKAKLSTEDLRNQLNPEKATLAAKQKILLDSALARANYDGAMISQAEVEQIIDAITVRISNLENELRNTTLAAGKTATVRDQLKGIQQELSFQRDMLQAQRILLEEAKKVCEYSRQIFLLEKNLKSEVDTQYQIHQRQERQKKLVEKETALEKKQIFWLEKLSDLTQQLEVIEQGGLLEDIPREKIQLQIFEAQERSNLLNLELVIARIYNQLSSVIDNHEDELSVTALNTVLAQLGMLLNEVKNVEVLVQRKMDLIQLREKINTRIQEVGIISLDDVKTGKGLLSDLYKNYSRELKQIAKVQGEIRAAQVTFQKELNHALSRRQGLPGFSLESWANLGEKLLLMPTLAMQAGKAILGQINRVIINLDAIDIAIVLLTESVLLGFWWYARKWLSKMSTRLSQSRRRMAENFLFVILKLILKNLTSLCLVSGIIIFFWLGKMPMMAISPIFYLLMVWFIFKMSVQLSRLLLVDNTSRDSGHDVRLYKNLHWAFSGGGLLTMLTVLAHQLPVGYEARDFFDRLFMVFMLVTSLVLLKSWRVVPELAASFIEGTRPYLMRLSKLLSVMVPLTILSTAVIGIFGYVELAWTLCKYEGIFLLILTGYMLMRGFLNDLTEWLSVLCIRHMRNGWLWTQAILRPFDKVMHLLLFLTAVATLFISYGWDSDSYVVARLDEIMNSHLIAYESTVITPLGIIKFMLTAAVLFWVARWTREFAYRWLFARTKDVGVRNSLAAFTQYITVVLCALIGLKIIGIDLATVSYILTALAFGIGFGLRDLAKNYVSGMFLLIERPVRVGDTVTMGEYEGEVKHIGMRAMAVETWDHMEVLVPNSQLFENSFVNWTHQDSIVRTVIKVRINRQDDPVRIENILYDLLEGIPEVVSDPEPQVLMMELQDALIEFEVRYFINLQQVESRVKIRSKVLFAIWECFKIHGIRPPHPQQDIHVLSLPTSADADAPITTS